MSGSEFREWQEYYVLEPFGQDRDNWHSAFLASLYASAHTKQGAQPPGVDQFMYRDSDTRREEADAQTLSFFEGLVH